MSEMCEKIRRKGSCGMEGGESRKKRREDFFSICKILGGVARRGGFTKFE